MFDTTGRNSLPRQRKTETSPLTINLPLYSKGPGQAARHGLTAAKAPQGTGSKTDPRSSIGSHRICWSHPPLPAKPQMWPTQGDAPSLNSTSSSNPLPKKSHVNLNGGVKPPWFASLQDKTSRLLSMTYPTWQSARPNALVSAVRWSSVWVRGIQYPSQSALATLREMVKCKHLSGDNPLFGFCHLWCRVSTSGIARSDDAREYHKNQKVFLTHHST